MGPFYHITKKDTINSQYISAEEQYTQNMAFQNGAMIFAKIML